MERLHALVSISDSRAGGGAPGTRPKALLPGSLPFGGRWGQSASAEDGWEPGVLLVGRGVIFDKCICGCGGVGVNDKKARTAVSVHIQVTWWKDGACLYLFLEIVCRVFACPSVLAGQTRRRSRHVDRAFCPSARLKVHRMLVDLDRTHQLGWAGSPPRANGPDLGFWHVRSHPGQATTRTPPCDQLHVSSKGDPCTAGSCLCVWQTSRVQIPTRSESSAAPGAALPGY